MNPKRDYRLRFDNLATIRQSKKWSLLDQFCSTVVFFRFLLFSPESSPNLARSKSNNEADGDSLVDELENKAK